MRATQTSATVWRRGHRTHHRAGYRRTALRKRGPSANATGQVASAQQVSDLMVNELVAALFKECDETTPQNVEHGKQAISLIFNDLNRNTFHPNCVLCHANFAPILQQHEQPR